MFNWRIAAALTFAGFCATASGAWADDGSFVGRWTLNAAQSKMSPDEPVPKAVMAEVTAADSHHVTWTSRVTDNKGQTHTETFDGVPDGKFYPITGDSKGVTASYTLKGGTIVSVFKGSTAEDTDTVTCVLSTTGKQLICDGTISFGKGHLDTYKDVYDRM
jgi:hypothetical protein